MVSAESKAGAGLLAEGFRPRSQGLWAIQTVSRIVAAPEPHAGTWPSGEYTSCMGPTRTMYVEQKTEGPRLLNDRGPAWIADVNFSNSGRSIRWRGKHFQRIRGGGVCGNYLCVEDGNEYWITGVKKRGSNRNYSNLPVIDTRGQPDSV